MPKEEHRHTFFYGWWVVIAVLVCNLVVVGNSTYAFSFFVRPLQEQFNWGRGEIMSAFTISFLCMAAGQMVAGRLIDRYGAKIVMAAGGLLIFLGFIVTFLMSSIWQLYSGYILVGTGAAAAGTTPAAIVVSNWFNRKRGLAIGLMAIGVGAGGLLMAPLVGNYLIPALGWRNAFLVLAVISGPVLISLSLFVIKTRPADMGLVPDGSTLPLNTGRPPIASISKGMTFRQSFRTSTFWLISLAYFLSSLAFMAVMQNEVPYLQDTGFTVAAAATTMSIMSLGSAFGKFGFGWVSDRIPAKYACTVGLCLQLTGITILLFTRGSTPLALIIIGAALFGIGMGSWLPTMSIMTGRQFGMTNYGSIFGAISFIQTLGASIGPLAAAYIFDSSNSYHLAFIICAASYAVSIPFIILLKKPK